MPLIKISETYIKFDLQFNESNKKIIKNAYLEYVGSQTKFLLNDSLDKNLIVTIEYEKGSLKTRIIVWGTSIYLVVANYGSFRAGIREMINDSKDFSGFICSTIIQDPQINANNIVTFQKRKGIPGRLDEIFIQIDSLQRNVNNLSPLEVQQKLNAIKQEIANIIFVLNPNDRNFFLNSLPENYRNQLPAPQDDKTQYLMNRYGSKPDENIEILN